MLQMKGTEMATDYKKRYEELVRYIQKETQAAKETSDMYFNLYDNATTDEDRDFWFKPFVEANDRYHTLWDIKFMAEHPDRVED